MVFPEKHFMERLFTPEIAAFYENFYKEKGVTIMPGNIVTAFEGVDGQVGSPTALAQTAPCTYGGGVRFAPCFRHSTVQGCL